MYGLRARIGMLFRLRRFRIVWAFTPNCRAVAVAIKNRLCKCVSEYSSLPVMTSHDVDQDADGTSDCKPGIEIKDSLTWESSFTIAPA